MKFEAGKLYKTKGGYKAQVFMLDNQCGWMFGAVLIHGGWIQISWKNDTGVCNDYQPAYNLVEEWKEPPKPKLLAPALCRSLSDKFFVTDNLFLTRDDASDYTHNAECYLIAWPAVPNKDGFYEVPSDDL